MPVLKHFPTTLYRGLLAFAIVAGSLITWLGIPTFWIWLAGRLSHDYPSIYIVALFGCPLTMIVWAWALYRLDGVYNETAAPPPSAPGIQRSAWLGSLSGDRKPRRRQASLLDLSMIVSVILALTVMAVWFFAFAQTSLPLPE